MNFQKKLELLDVACHFNEFLKWKLPRPLQPSYIWTWNRNLTKSTMNKLQLRKRVG